MSMNDPNRPLGNPFGPKDDGSPWALILGILVLVVIVGGIVIAGKSNQTRTATHIAPITQPATTGSAPQR
jgi:hypothetical protein